MSARMTPQEMHARIVAQRPPWVQKLAKQLRPHQPQWCVACVQCRQDWDAGRDKHCAGYQGFPSPEGIDRWIEEHKRYKGHQDVELVEWPEGWNPDGDLSAPLPLPGVSQ